MQFETFHVPFLHFSLKNALPEDILEKVRILALQLVPKDMDAGSRGEIKSRLHLSKNLESHSYIGDYLNGPLRQKISKFIENQAENYPALNGISERIACEKLRAEICCDGPGFWLEPHLDVSEKSITIVIYINGLEAGHNLGTDLYDINKKFCKSASYSINEALMFCPTDISWHGFEKGKSFLTNRVTLIINFVKNWRDLDELYAQ